MVELKSRKSWTGHGPAKAPARLRNPRGFAVHWPGSSQDRIDASNEGAIADRIEGFRRDHVNDRGWYDIAYQVVIDQEGRIWQARGLSYQSAANGDREVNRLWGAVLLLVGDSEGPSRAMVDAVRWWRTKRWLARYPGATGVVGHRDLHSTDCPGPHVHALVRSGAFRAQREDDDMELTDKVGLGPGARTAVLNATGQQIRELTLADLLQRMFGLLVTLAYRPAGSLDIEALAEELARETDAAAVRDALLELLPAIRISAEG